MSLVILKTLKALKIRTALKADKFEPPDPNDNSTILIQTTKESKIFIMSPKKSNPKANILMKRSNANTKVNTVFKVE